jgi:hydroxymethylbilane synthase
MSTRGDCHAGPLDELGGKGLFTAELAQALGTGLVDMVVHSAKDLPAEDPPGLVIAATPIRADPRDALVTACPGLDELPPGAKVGTASPRRSALLRRLRDDLQILPLRGNVETRLAKAIGQTPELDAVVLARAGLLRSGLAGRFARNIHTLACETFIPAAGQGTLAIQTRADDAELIDLLGGLNDRATHEALAAERAFLRTLGASCHSCVAVYIRRAQMEWRGDAMFAHGDGSDMKLASVKSQSARAAGEILASKILAMGS